MTSKKKTSKGVRLLSIFLSVMLTTTMVPVFAFAIEESGTQNKDRMAEILRVDLANDHSEISVLDADKIQSLQIDDISLSIASGEYQVSSDKVILTAAGAAKLAAGSYELKITFAEEGSVAEERANLTIIDTSSVDEDATEESSDLGNSDSNPIVGNANEEANQSDSDATDTIEDTTSFSESVSGGIEPNSSSASGILPLGNEMVPFDDDTVALTATYNQIALGAGSSITFASAGDFVNNPKALHIEASFTDGAPDKKIVIEIPLGMSLYDAPGMTAKSSSTLDNWNFSQNNLPGNLRDFITGATWEQAQPFKVSDGESGTRTVYQPKAGTLTYTISSDNTNISMDLLVCGDVKLMAATDTLVLDHDTAETLTIAAEQAGITKSTVMETISIDCDTYWMLSGSSKREVRAAGQEWSLPLSFLYFTNGLKYETLSVNPTFKEGKATISMSKDAEISGLVHTSGNISLSDYSVEIDRNSSTSVDYLTITFNESFNFDYPTFRLQGTLKEGISLKPSYNYTVYTSGNNYFDTYFEERVTSSKIGIVNTPYLVVAEDTKNLTASNKPATIHADEIHSEAALTRLGAFYVENKNAYKVDNKRARITFDASDSPAYNVYALNLACGVEGITNIWVTTKSNPTGFAVDDAGYTSRYTASDAESYMYFAFLNLREQLELSGDYITSIEYDMGTINLGASPYHTAFSGEGLDNFHYYGRLLKAESFKATISFYNILDEGEASTTLEPDGVSTTYTTTITSGSYRPSYSTSGTGGGQVTAGATKLMTVSVNLYNYRYSLDTLGSYKGFTFYVRQPEGITAVESTINISQGSIQHTNFITSKGFDKDNNPVLIIKVPDAVVGFTTDKGAASQPLKLSIEIKTDGSATYQEIPHSAIFAVTLLDPAYKGISNYAQTTRADEYNVAGQGTDHYVGRATDTTAGLTIAPDPTLVVTTAADKADDDWKSYNGFESSIVDLIAGESARYKISFANNTQDAISGYSVIIPIPKVGESAGTYFQNADFEWPVSLDAAIENSLVSTNIGAGNYTVKYNLDYVNDYEDANWVNWDTVKDDPEKIKAILLTTTGSLSNDVTDKRNVEEVYFEIAVPSAADGSTYNGKKNEYSSRIHATVSGTAGYKTSEPVAIRLSGAVIKGTVSSVKTPSDIASTPVSGITVNAYQKTPGGEPDYASGIISTTYTGPDGSYTLSNLLSGTEYFVEFVNPHYNNYSGELPLSTALQFSSSTDYAIQGDHSKAVTVAAVPAGGSTGVANVANITMLTPLTVKYVYGSKVNINTEHLSQLAFYDSSTVKPIDPSVSEHSFIGWYKDAAWANAWTFNTDKIMADGTTIYGKLRQNTYSYKVEYYRDSVTPENRIATEDGAENFILGHSLTATEIETDLGSTWLNAKKPSAVGDDYADGSTGSQLPFAITNNAANNVIQVLYVKNTYGYKVEYYKDTLDTENLIGTISGVSTFVADTVLTDSAIATDLENPNWINAEKPTAGDYGEGVYSNAFVAISSTPADNVVKVLYKKNTYGYKVEYYKHNTTDSSNLLDTVTSARKYIEGHPLVLLDIQTDSNLGSEWLNLKKPAQGYGDGVVQNDLIISSIASNNVIKVLYSPNSYAVTYHANNGTSDSSVQGVKYNESFTVKNNSFSYPGYTFSGWYTKEDGSAGGQWYPTGLYGPYSIIGNLDLYAQWSANTDTVYTVKHYQVDASGKADLVNTQTLKGTTGATVTAQPMSYAAFTVDYNYAGTARTGIIAGNGSLVLELYYPINRYTVMFVDWNAINLATRVNVPHGGSVNAPTTPPRIGYTFNGWDRAFTNVTSNLTVTAQYTQNTYTVTFVDWNGSVLGTSTVAYGRAASAPASPLRTGYTFNGWDRAFTNITSNLTVTAQYTQNTYTVTFVDWNGSVLATSTVNYGGNASAPAEPTRTGHTFSGWDSIFTNVTSNLTVMAQYEINTYAITFVDGQGATLKSETVNYGGSATPPPDPTRTGYRFNGWDLDSAIWTNVTSDATITAQWIEESTSTTVTPVTPTSTTVETVDTTVTGLSVTEIEQLENQTGNPFVDIANDSVPLGNFTASGVWSLLSIILVLLGLLNSLGLAILSTRRKKQQGEYVDSQGEKHIITLRNKNENKAFVVGLAAIIVAVVSLVVWLLFDDPTLSMTWINSLTPVILGFFIVNVILTIVRAVLKKFGEPNDEEGQVPQAQAAH